MAKTSEKRSWIVRAPWWAQMDTPRPMGEVGEVLFLSMQVPFGTRIDEVDEVSGTAVRIFAPRAEFKPNTPSEVRYTIYEGPGISPSFLWLEAAEDEGGGIIYRSEISPSVYHDWGRSPDMIQVALYESARDCPSIQVCTAYGHICAYAVRYQQNDSGVNLPQDKNIWEEDVDVEEHTEVYCPICGQNKEDGGSK